MKKLYSLVLAFIASVTLSHAATITGKWGDNLNWSLDTKAKVLTITGTGDMQENEDYSSPWEEYLEYIETVKLPDGLTSICDYAFYNCEALSDIEIPNSVTSIGDWAFYNCTALTSAKIGNGVEYIGSDAFCDCYALSSVTLGENLVSIGPEAFYSCSNLRAITFPNKLKWLQERAFSNCKSLTSIEIPNSVTYLGQSAFSSCQKLASVTLGNGISQIPSNLFSYCYELVSIEIPDNYTNIGSSAFSYCSKLSHVIIGKGVKTIGDYAFSSCNKLYKLTVRAIVPPANAKNSELNNKNCALFVPAESVDVYGDTYWWEEFASIQSLEEDDGLVSSCDYGMYYIAGSGYNPQTQEQYAVAGWCNGLEWEHNGCRLEMEKNNLFSKTFSLPAGTYQFKLTATDKYDDSEIWFGQNDVDEDEVVECENHIYFADISDYGYNCTFSISEADLVKVSYDCSENIIRVERLRSSSPVIKYEVKFLDWDGKVLKTDSVEEGKAAIAPADPVREGYTFTGWDKKFSNVRYDLVVTAQYAKNQTNMYAVFFLDWDGSLLDEQSVEEGAAAEAPTVPVREGYTFNGWSQDISKIVNRTFAVAQYQANGAAAGYAIVFKDGIDGKELGRMNVDLSIPMVAYHEGYTFSGWEVTTGNILAGITILANYTPDNASGISERQSNDEQTHKILRNGQLFILRGDKTYTTTGQVVK